MRWVIFLFEAPVLISLECIKSIASSTKSNSLNEPTVEHIKYFL